MDDISRSVREREREREREIDPRVNRDRYKVQTLSALRPSSPVLALLVHTMDRYLL
jgi:hypothetical protein